MNKNQIKQSILDEIEKRIKNNAQKNSQKEKITDIQKIAFNFFKRVEECQIDGIARGNEKINSPYNATLLIKAIDVLSQELRRIDVGSDVDITFTKVDGINYIQGITIMWSLPYQQKYNTSQHLYIDVGEMLLI